MPDLAQLSTKKTPALRIELPGGAVLTRAPGQKNGPVTCSRCHQQSGPAGVYTLTEFTTWARKHHGSECQP